ncbi:MAG: ATP-binding cassette domain-containing protein [Thermosediminibacteraceae bacterium]|nr:ATP-binding cassette domain-containing protein [Thermosediminibacteraceae bacterium]PZN04942.1 MAG: energy-coupling factor ABC transporter ATP-binding protein [Bacillota bacterium]
MGECWMELKDVYYKYPGGEWALKGINLRLEKGKKVAILGPNGAGKSTLLLHLIGILKPKKGAVYFDGSKVEYTKAFLKRLRQKVGLVFQDPDTQMFAGSVFQEVAFGPLNLGLEEQEVRNRVLKALEVMGIEDLKHRPVHFLSYGQKKKVAIASVLAMSPEVLVFDEPTAYLDPKSSAELVEIMEKLYLSGKQIVISTHDVDLAFSFADWIVVMKDGRVLAQGSPVEIFTDKDIISESGLEMPLIVKIGTLLKKKGLLKGTFPRNFEQLASKLEDDGGD